MSLPITSFSEDQAEAFDRIAEVMRSAGVDTEDALLLSTTCLKLPFEGNALN